jgi:hypothetical protein
MKHEIWLYDDQEIPIFYRSRKLHDDQESPHCYGTRLVTQTIKKLQIFKFPER